MYRHEVLVEADELRPFNIAASFARALLLSIERESRNQNTSAAKLARELEILKDDFGPVKNLIDILFFGSEKRTRIYTLEQKISESRSEVKALRPHRAVLERIARNSQ